MSTLGGGRQDRAIRSSRLVTPAELSRCRAANRGARGRGEGAVSRATSWPARACARPAIPPRLRGLLAPSVCDLGAGSPAPARRSPIPGAAGLPARPCLRARHHRVILLGEQAYAPARQGNRVGRYRPAICPPGATWQPRDQTPKDAHSPAPAPVGKAARGNCSTRRARDRVGAMPRVVRTEAERGYDRKILRADSVVAGRQRSRLADE